VGSTSIQIGGIKINLYDLGGLKGIRDYWEYYYDQVDALIYVLDASDKDRIKECNEVFRRLLKEKELLGVPFLFYANKMDILNCLGPDEIIEELELEDIKGRDWSLYGCSFLKSIGIKDGMKWLSYKLNYDLCYCLKNL
jgi:ADP-ribosylation factor-like protein 3